jgi:uroporphyrinogen III methyltransferase/synthase
MTNVPEKPLAAKRIVVTRAPEQAQDLVHELERFGAEAILLPVVAFESPQDSGPLDRALGELFAFDWVLFTSQNAVRFLSRRLEQLGLEKIAQRIAAVGPATAEVAKQQGFPVDYVATHHTAHSLADELRASINGRRVLLPHSDRADTQIANALRESGAQVTDVIAYRTIAPEAVDQAVLDRIRVGGVDVIIFSSPSAFHNLASFLGVSHLVKLAESMQFAAIGPTTARAMRETGVRVHIEAEEASAAGLADAIVKHYQDRPNPPRQA